MKYTIPAGDLVNTFEVSPAASGGAYQRDETYHCFDVDSNGFPTYVRGVAQGYWYFEGPITNDGLAVLVLYTNDLRFGEYPITGSLTLNYTLDFTTATVNSVACSPSYLCDRWPTELTGGVDASLTGSQEVVNCMYNRTAPLAGLNAVVSEFSSATGTTYFCSNPTTYQPSAVNGSWVYINNAANCASRNEDYPCPNNVGPYNNGIGKTLPDGKGFIITQWNGWNFGDPDHQNGRTMFAAVSDIFISGCYCVYNDATGKIKYCYPEQYDTSPSDSATEAECATNWYNAPTMAPTSGPAASTSSKKKVSQSESVGLGLGLGLGVVILALVIYIWKMQVSSQTKYYDNNGNKIQSASAVANRTSQLGRGNGDKVMNPVVGATAHL
jgi:hypothetical protein